LNELEAARTHLLQCLATHDALSILRPQDGDLKILSSMACDGLALIAARKNHRDEAAKFHRKAVESAESLVKQSPANSQHLKTLFTMLIHAGDTFRDIDKLADASEMMKRAVALADQIANQDPADDEAQRNLASATLRHSKLLERSGDREAAIDWCTSLQALGTLRTQQRQHGAATDALKSAAEILARFLSSSAGANGQVRRDLVQVLSQLAAAAVKADRIEDALSAREQLVTLLERPTSTDISTAAIRQLAIAHENLGQLQRDVGQRSRSVQSLSKTLALHERISRTEPLDIGSRHDRIAAVFQLGHVAFEQYRVDEARRLFERARDELNALPKDDSVVVDKKYSNWPKTIAKWMADCDDAERALTDPQVAEQRLKTVPLIMMIRVAELARRGESDAATASAERLAALAEEQDVGLWFLAARAFAVCSASTELSNPTAAAEHGRRAIELLVQARESGLFKNGMRAARLRWHEDLDVLRGREDFQQFVRGTLPDNGTLPDK